MCVVALSGVALVLAMSACSSDKSESVVSAPVENTTVVTETAATSTPTSTPTSAPTSTPKPTPVMRLANSTMYYYSSKYETPYGNFGTMRNDGQYKEYSESGDVSVTLSEDEGLFYQYNEEGQLIQETRVVVDYYEEITDYEYDGDKLIHKEQTRYNNSNVSISEGEDGPYVDIKKNKTIIPEVVTTVDYVYDGDKLVRETQENEIFKYDRVYEYDDSGVMVAMINDSEWNLYVETPYKLYTKTLYTYDSEGRVIKEDEYYWDGNSLGDLYTSNTYEYDSDGNLIQKVMYDSRYDSNYIDTYEYDDYGSLSKMTVSCLHLDPKMPKSTDYTFEYFYDNVYVPVESEIDAQITESRTEK